MSFLVEDPLMPRRKRRKRIVGLYDCGYADGTYDLYDDIDYFPLFLFYGLSQCGDL